MSNALIFEWHRQFSEGLEADEGKKLRVVLRLQGLKQKFK